MNRRLHGSVLLILLAGFVGCTDIGDPLPPGCELSGRSLDFGQIAPGDSTAQTLTLLNTGSTSFDGTVILTGGAFRLASGPNTYTLEPGQSVQFLVSFAPPDTGVYAGEMDTGSECGRVPLSGVGRNPVQTAQCEVTPPSLDFGEVESGMSASRTFKLFNTGSVDFDGVVSLSCTDYVTVAGGGPFQLAPDDSLEVIVEFTPTTIGPSSCVISTGVNCATVTCTGSGVPGETVFFATDIQPIFNGRCAVSSCHIPPVPTGGLDLSAGVSYGNLVDVTSRAYSPAVRIAPGDPGASVLYNKVANTGLFGQRMPPVGGALSPAQVDLIRTWIIEGAREN